MTLSLLGPASGSALEELVSIYTNAFPATERKPVNALHTMLASPAYRFLAAREGGVCVGFAIVALLAGNEAALLEYMAVRSDRRGEGLGHRLFRETAAAVLAGTRQTLLIELESDGHAGPHQSDQGRRKRFYRSLGARQLEGVSWIMPPVAAGLPPPMDLFVYSPGASTLAKGQLQHWMARIYVEVYAQSPNDPRLALMAASLPAHIALR